MSPPDFLPSGCNPGGRFMSLSSAMALAVCFGVCFTAASSGSMFRPGAWYTALRKPGWTPPNLAFPIVWGILFCAMAVAAWRVWETAGMAAWPALSLFGAHLPFNALWSFLFFGIRRLDWALGGVAILWLLIAAVITAFWQISLVAALLLAPYLAWVTVAATLNLRLLQLNGGRGNRQAELST
jgi:tryptophan-rich sensory protein